MIHVVDVAIDTRLHLTHLSRFFDHHRHHTSSDGVFHAAFYAFSMKVHAFPLRVPAASVSRETFDRFQLFCRPCLELNYKMFEFSLPFSLRKEKLTLLVQHQLHFPFDFFS